jgi:hypothetical protein
VFEEFRTFAKFSAFFRESSVERGTGNGEALPPIADPMPEHRFAAMRAQPFHHHDHDPRRHLGRRSRQLAIEPLGAFVLALGLHFAHLAALLLGVQEASLAQPREVHPVVPDRESAVVHDGQRLDQARAGRAGIGHDRRVE